MSSSSPAVTIPAVTATHVVGKSEVELGNGDLTLLVLKQPSSSSPTATSPTTEQPPILALTVGQAAFPLFKSTDFGTVAGDERLYVFSPQVGEKIGYVKLTLPGGVKEEGSEFAKLQEQFEKVLIDHGLLRDGVAAAGDERGRTQEHAGSLGQKARGGIAEYPEDQIPTQDPTASSATAHAAASSNVSVTGSLYDVAAKIGNTVGNAASTAGAWFASKAVLTTHEKIHAPDQLGDVYNPSTSGSASGAMQDTTFESVSHVIGNQWDLEARGIGRDVAKSAEDKPEAVGQAVPVTSGAEGGLSGAVVAKHEQQITGDDTKQKERQVSGQWQDVPV